VVILPTCYSGCIFETVIRFEIKGEKMIKNSKQANVFKWVFFLISAGALMAAGIFIKKIISSEVVWLDYFSAVVFCAIGMGISAYVFFHSSPKQ
jgi:hypothetical protein